MDLLAARMHHDSRASPTDEPPKPPVLANAPERMNSFPPSTPLVTIAIPTFNRARSYLPRALRAACVQTYANLDILVADNASTDDTAAVVASMGDARVRYHRHPENMGSARNTNFCIESSRGEYTLLLNDDDLIDEDFIEVCMDAIADGQRPGLIRTGMRLIDESGRVVHIHVNQVGGLDFAAFVVAWTQGLTVPYLCNTLFRTRNLQEIGLHSRHYMWDDVIAELKIAAVHGRVDIADVHASSCEHGGELTRAASVREWCEDAVELTEVACSLAPDDAPQLRAHLTPFLAEIAYRRAAQANAPLIARLAGGLTAFRTFRVPPEFPLWFKQVLGRERWYRRLAKLKPRRQVRASSE